MSDPTATSASAVIDNGAFGTRTIRFETGRLAQQAAGSVAAFLDEDTMLLSATTAGKHPKEQFDFFPLTIDVEERMYAAGRIPGSFFRREGRPSEDAILTCRLIDRPLRPTFKAGLRNEVQVVITVMALNPDELYDVLAINAASASTQISGLPFSGPVAGVRVALIDGQWVAFPTHPQLEKAVFDMVVAGRIAGDDVAIMMVEAEATENTIELIAGGATAPTEEVVAEGLEAAKPFLKVLCEAQSELADQGRQAGCRLPGLPALPGRRLRGRRAAAVEAGLADALTLTGKQERDNRTDEIKAVVYEQLSEQFAGRTSEIGNAFRSVTKKLVRQRVLRGQGPDRRPRADRHPHPGCRGRLPAAGARQRAVRARRDPDPGRHHAEHAPDGAAAGHALAGEPQALHAQLQLPAVLHRRDRSGRLAQAPRNRPRRARRARPGAGAAEPRGVPLRDPPGVGSVGLQRFHLDGFGLRLDPVACSTPVCR